MSFLFLHFSRLYDLRNLVWNNATVGALPQTFYALNRQTADVTDA